MSAATAFCEICRREVRQVTHARHTAAHQIAAADTQLNPQTTTRLVAPPTADAPQPQHHRSVNMPAEIEREMYDGPLESECVICMNSRRNAAAFPCGHTYFCLPCLFAYVGKPCPYCGKIIQKMCHVYI